MMRLLILIPAYNEATTIEKVIRSIPSKIDNQCIVDVLVVSDGSNDSTNTVLQKMGIKYLNHIINRGLGATLATGFEYAKTYNYDLVLTFDADGQHQAEDINKLVKPILKDRTIDVVIGSRFINKDNQMPIFRKIINVLSNYLTYILFNIWTTDSQSGLRVFRKEALNKITIKSQRMEVSSEIFKEIATKHLHVVEVPVKSIYTPYSLTKGQPISNSINVLWKLILHKFS
jgi:UDP-N-acetylglucosamine---dolichyl-phosphate N-acetylglucosaminyltransferase